MESASSLFDLTNFGEKSTSFLVDEFLLGSTG